ncbi:hypothetical protein HAX54_023954, partial [Datura stramonium]|nr:hypothetical protein [Datura stramonium]
MEINSKDYWSNLKSGNGSKRGISSKKAVNIVGDGKLISNPSPAVEITGSNKGFGIVRPNLEIAPAIDYAQIISCNW